jgi:hypothetical protein
VSAVSTRETERADGTFWMFLPHTEEGENLSPNYTLMAGFALGLALQDQGMIDVLWHLLDRKRRTNLTNCDASDAPAQDYGCGVL